LPGILSSSKLGHHDQQGREVGKELNLDKFERSHLHTTKLEVRSKKLYKYALDRPGRGRDVKILPFPNIL
jgi:hypothetical protein